MENSDEPIPVPHDEALHFWVNLEACNSTQSADLLQETATEKTAPVWSLIAFGLAFYLTFAIAFIALCLCCNSPRLGGAKSEPARHALVAPKYMTFVKR